MPELNIVDTGAGAVEGRIQSPYLYDRVPGYNYGDGTGYLEYGQGTPGSLPFRVDQAGNVTAASISASIQEGLQPSGDTSGVKDTAAIQALLTANTGPVVLAAGTFYLNAALTMVTGNTLQGAGMHTTTINQVTTTAHGISASTATSLVVRDLALAGPGSGSGDGIHFTTSGSAVANCLISKVAISAFGGNGFFGNTMITSAFQVVETFQNALDGFHITGGTSLQFSACYSNGDTGNGFNLNGLSYASLNGCASDSNAIGYLVQGGGNDVVLTGCGAEAQTGAASYKITGTSTTTLTGCYSANNPGIAFWFTGSAVSAVCTGCKENNPAGGATASIQVDAGSTVTVMSPAVVTAASYAAGTVSKPGQTTMLLSPAFTSGTGTGVQNVTGFSYALPVGTYRLRAWIPYIGAGVVGSTQTFAFSIGTIATSAVRAFWQFWTSAYTAPVFVTSLAGSSGLSPTVTSTETLLTYDAVVTVTTAGTLQLTVQSTTSGDEITIKDTAYLEILPIVP